MQKFAAGDVLEPGDDAQQGRLAAAGGPDEDDELAVADVEVDAVDDFGGPKDFGLSSGRPRPFASSANL